tara:strand:- start:553 stop:1044 length:492 start_codon:yes stop_codon:yes gene_type:complete
LPGPFLSLLAGLCAAAVMLVSPVVRAEELLWSNEVRRIDPSQQDYERLPPRAPTVLPNTRPKGAFRVRGFFRVRDSVSFIYRKKSYKLSGAEPVANSKICVDKQGRRWGCGIMARNRFEELLTSRDVFCVPTGEADAWVFVKCGKEGLDVAAEMIERGFAETR